MEERRGVIGKEGRRRAAEERTGKMKGRKMGNENTSRYRRREGRTLRRMVVTLLHGVGGQRKMEEQREVLLCRRQERDEGREGRRVALAGGSVSSQDKRIRCRKDREGGGRKRRLLRWAYHLEGLKNNLKER